jgi:putative endonuclease
MRRYYVYILTNQRKQCLYTGMTNDLGRRMREHRQGSVPGFSKRYNLDQLIYAEAYPTAVDAIQREKQLKGWRRVRKIALIEAANPDWQDLTDDIPFLEEGLALRSFGR